MVKRNVYGNYARERNQKKYNKNFKYDPEGFVSVDYQLPSIKTTTRNVKVHFFLLKLIEKSKTSFLKIYFFQVPKKNARWSFIRSIIFSKCLQLFHFLQLVLNTRFSCSYFFCFFYFILLYIFFPIIFRY